MVVQTEDAMAAGIASVGAEAASLVPKATSRCSWWRHLSAESEVAVWWSAAMTTCASGAISGSEVVGN